MAKAKYESLAFNHQTDRPAFMGLRTRKLVGTLAIFVWMVVFSLTVMAVLYAVLGFGWILPLKPIFVWMGKAPRPDEPVQ